MSSSPIIQERKLVGAVTYVLVNAPTRGYDVFTENMLEKAAYGKVTAVIFHLCHLLDLYGIFLLNFN